MQQPEGKGKETAGHHAGEMADDGPRRPSVWTTIRDAFVGDVTFEFGKATFVITGAGNVRRVFGDDEDELKRLAPSKELAEYIDRAARGRAGQGD